MAGAEKAPATFSACEIIAAFASLLRITATDNYVVGGNTRTTERRDWAREGLSSS